MNKKVLSIVLALAITLCLSIVVMASTATPGGTVNIDQITDLVWDQDQEELTKVVTGYVAFDSSNDVPKLETLELEVQRVGSKGWTTIDSKNYTESPKDSVGLPDYSDAQGYEFDFKDWTIEAEGTYKLRVTATFTDSFAKAKATITVAVTPDTDEDSKEEDLDKNKVKNEDEGADTLNEDDGNCPAAPAVAGKLLKEHKVKNHYEGGNYIADVAKKMGPNGEFRDVQKCDIDEYQKEIEDFLDEQGAFDEEITEEIANETQQNQSDKKSKHNQK